jgi:hypothetical protein
VRLTILVFALIVAACSAEKGRAVNVGASDDARFVCNGNDERAVLDEIKKHGADLKRQREAVFYFYGPQAKLGDLEAGLKVLGFAVRPTSTEPGRIATMNAVVDEAWLGTIIPKLCKLSNDLGVEYDGWEASIPEAAGKH